MEGEKRDEGALLNYAYDKNKMEFRNKEVDLT